jgi:hypothetical protein
MTTPADQAPDDTSGKAPSGPQDGPNDPAGGPGAETGPDKPQTAKIDKADHDDADTFSKEYVQRLRDEAAAHRVKAKRVDVVTQRLVTAMAAQTNRLADPTDLTYSDDLLDDDGLPDESKVAEAIEQLLATKPHLASRRPHDSDVGQGAQPESDTLSLADLLRQGA